MARGAVILWDAFETACMCRSKLRAAGLTLSVVQGAAAVHRVVGEIEKPYLTPWLDPARNDFTPKNHFWLVASSARGPEIVGGARLDDMGDAADAAVLSMFQRGYGAGSVLSVSGDVARMLRGRAVYFGDLHSRSSRGMGRRNVRWFLGVANYLSLALFRHDVVYSFIRQADILRGSADVNGFAARIANPVEWGEVPAHRDLSEVIALRRRCGDAAYFEAIKQELGGSRSEQAADPLDLTQARQA